MATATDEQTRLSPNQLKAANRMLEYLDSVKETNWQQKMRDQLTDSEYEKAAANIDRALAAMGGSGPAGAIVGGTGLAKEEARIEGEDAQIAIQALKANHRLVQCGRGRGKLLVLVSSEPLSSSVTYTPKAKVAKADKKDQAKTSGANGGKAKPAKRTRQANRQPAAPVAVTLSPAIADQFEELGRNLQALMEEMARSVRASQN